MVNAAPNTSSNRSATGTSSTLSRWLRWLLVAALLVGISLRFVNIAPKHKAVSFAEARTALSLSGRQFSDLRLALSSASFSSGDHPQAFILNRDLAPFQSIPILERLGENPPTTSVTVWRIVSGGLSLLVIPAAWGLVRAIGPNRTHSSGASGKALVLPLTLVFLAVSPLHLAFAQEAQPAAITFALLLAAQTLLFQGIQRKNWFAYLGYGLSLALLAWLLQLNPLSVLGVGAMLLELVLYVAIALVIQHAIQPMAIATGQPLGQPSAHLPAQPRPGRGTGLKNAALGVMAVVIVGAIALNIAQVMDFSGWLKGSTNGNLAIAQQLREHPAPLVSDPQGNHDLLSILSLSHSLPDDAQWLVLSSNHLTTGSGITDAGPAAVLPKLSYLYRPSPTLLSSVQASSRQAIQPLGNELWRWGSESTTTATP